MELVFWSSIALIFYIFAGYPMLAWLLGRVIGRSVKKAPFEPSVTVIIPAYNEAANIEETIRNKLEQDYPEDKLRVIVASDASTDGTDELARQAGPRVLLLRQPTRAGKTAALNNAVRATNSEILVFSDANSLYDRSAVRRLVSNFADKSIGYVTGKMVYAAPDGSIVGDGCTAYMRYENWIRIQESRLASVIGVDGGLDACRAELYVEMRNDQLPDFVLPLSIAETGFRVVYEPAAVVQENSLTKGADEYRMRVRVATRAFWALWDKRKLMNPFRHGLLALQLVSHKLLRYLAFIFLVLAFVANVSIADESPLYLSLLILQILFYLGAVVPLLRLGSPPPFASLPYYFVLLNVASANALLLVMTGERKATWAPRAG